MRRILVAADDRTQTWELQLALAAEGFLVQAAADGQQALDLLRASNFDLVVAAAHLPGLSGFELCRAIRADPVRKEVPVILLTALDRPADVFEALDCGADSFLSKPYQSGALLDRVVRILAAGREEVGPADRAREFLRAALEELMRARRQAGPATAESRYKQLLKCANDAIAILDPLGKVLEVNHRAEALLGLPCAEIVGQPYERFVHPAKHGCARERFQELLSGAPVRMDNVSLQRGDGRPVCVDLSASLVETDGDRAVLAIARDATELARLEEQLRQAQKMEAIGRLASGIAHDFNNLLTIIRGYSEILLDRLVRHDPARRLVREITRAGEQAASLTRRLLAFSRKQVLEPRVLDLNALVSDTVTMLARLIGEDIEFRTLLDPALGRVEADPGQLEQVIINLVINARDAMPQGGTLTVGTANVDLDEASAQLHPGARPGRYVMLFVSDTGCGMDEATKAHLFEPFFTTKGPGEGTGLGLATVFGIVVQSGGHIEVESEPGRGATFKVYLPYCEARAAPADKAPPNLSRAPRGTGTILLVEDDDGVRALSGHVLRDSGYTVLEARDGREAVKRSEAYPGPIDLLVTDVVMPHMGGQELAARLRAQRPGLKVLFLSGYPDEAVLRHGVSEGGAPFLEKPFTPSTLADKVQEVLSKQSV